MADEYLDPTDSVAVPRKTALRSSTLDGKVVTPLDISKAKGDHLLDRARPKAIVRKRTPTFARPAPDPIQPLTREEVRLLADQAFDEILRQVTA